MNLKKLVDLRYVYKRRHRIWPNLVALPRNLALSVQRFLAVNFSLMNSNDRDLILLKGKHIGRRCFIIGNGPSLRMDDLQELHELGEITFAFNKIYLAFEKTDFRPSYYIVEDPLVVKYTREHILALEPFPKLFAYDYKPVIKGASNTHYYYLKLGGFLPGRPVFSPDPFSIRWGATVTYSALQFAFYFGCNPIYLIGCDFSFNVPKTKDQRNPDLLIAQNERNHFHPDYRPVGEKWFAPKLEEQQRAFESAHAYANQHNIRIFNATRGGCLEVFDRRNLDAVLNSIRKK